MAISLDAIGSALATRYNATNTTAPSGESPVHESTHYLPLAVTSTPTVLVFPPVGSFEAAPGGPIRFGELPFPVRVLVGEESDRPTTMRRAYLWFDALLDQPFGNTNLGLSYITDCFATGFRIGEFAYSGTNYITVEFEVRVRLVQSVSPIYQ